MLATVATRSHVVGTDAVVMLGDYPDVDAIVVCRWMFLVYIGWDQEFD